MAYLWHQGLGRLSFQVLQEFYGNATQKLRPGLPADEARRDVQALFAWHPVKTGPALIKAAWNIMDRFGCSWWDAQIVAAARLSECTQLLSEDLQHGLVVDGTVILNPFASGQPFPE